MSMPRFSVVIPTRDRANTLRHTLRTCLAQAFQDYEIVVSDNCSQPETRQVVESFGSDRIKYVRSDTPLAMAANWELALANAVGEYVIVIGDDDALLPDALSDLSLFIDKTAARAIRWAVVSYTWPDVLGGWVANKIHIPIPTATLRIDSHQAIREVLSARKDYSFLPMLYYSAIHRDLVADLRKATGAVFKGACPDIYTAFAMAYVAGTHYLLGKPMTIVGYSGKSNGIAYLAEKAENSIAREFRALNQSAGYSPHPQVPNLPVMSAMVADEFLRAKQGLFPAENALTLERKQLIMGCIRDLELSNWGPAEWDALMSIIAASLADDRRLLHWFESSYRKGYEPQKRPWIFSADTWQDGLTGNSLFLDGAKYGATDVYGVSELCRQFISNATPFTEVQKFRPEELHTLRQRIKALVSGR